MLFCDCCYGIVQPYLEGSRKASLSRVEVEVQSRGSEALEGSRKASLSKMEVKVQWPSRPENSDKNHWNSRKKSPGHVGETPANFILTFFKVDSEQILRRQNMKNSNGRIEKTYHMLLISKLFIFFKNGMIMEPDALTIQQNSDELVLTIDSSELGYQLIERDEILAWCKFKY